MRLRNYLIERNLIDLSNFINHTIDSVIYDKRITRNDIKKWLKTHFRKWMINDYEGVYRLNRWPGGHYLLPPIWFKRAIAKGEKVYDFTGDIPQQRLYHILDYFIANSDVRIERMTFKQAEKNAEKWVQELRKRGKEHEDKSAVEEVMKIGSYRWVKLVTQEACDREGLFMNHCVSDYFDTDSDIYSLRDSKNKPHVTIEIGNNRLRQIKGNSNQPPKKEYVKYIIEFLNKSKFKISSVYDLDTLGLIAFNYRDGSKIYDVNNLPKSLKTKGSLSLQHITNVEYIRLPNDLEVGALILPYNTPIYLPKNKLKITVDGFNISRLNIFSMPKEMYINGHLTFRVNGPQIKKNPEIIKSEGNIYVYGGNINIPLPKTIIAENIEFEYIDKNIKMPDEIRAKKYIILHKCNVKVIANKNLDAEKIILVDSKVETIKKNTKIRSNISLNKHSDIINQNSLPDFIQKKIVKHYN